MAEKPLAKCKNWWIVLFTEEYLSIIFVPFNLYSSLLCVNHAVMWKNSANVIYLVVNVCGKCKNSCFPSWRIHWQVASYTLLLYYYIIHINGKFSGGVKIKKSPGQKNSWKQINQFHDIFHFNQIPFLAIFKIAKKWNWV